MAPGGPRIGVAEDIDRVRGMYASERAIRCMQSRVIVQKPKETRHFEWQGSIELTRIVETPHIPRTA